MSAPAPMPFEWTGEEFRPVGRFRKVCDAAFVVGQKYMLLEHQERSSASHAFFFATLHDMWLSLPDESSERFPTEDHLRRYALIKTGFADCRQMVASSKAEAQRWGAFLRPCDQYAVITVKDCVVTVWTARSQSMKAMGRKDFEASKNAVLDYVAGLLGVEPKQLEREAGKAA